MRNALWKKLIDLWLATHVTIIQEDILLKLLEEKKSTQQSKPYFYLLNQLAFIPLLFWFHTAAFFSFFLFIALFPLQQQENVCLLYSTVVQFEQWNIVGQTCWKYLGRHIRESCVCSATRVWKLPLGPFSELSCEYASLEKLLQGLYEAKVRHSWMLTTMLC